MIYLLILVGAGLVLQSLYFGKVLISVKRRCKAMDAKLSNLNQWVITANQSVTTRLGKMHELIYLVHYKSNQADNNTNDDSLESSLINLLTDLSKKENHHYYLALLEQLRQMKKHADKGHAVSETMLRPVNGFANAKTVI